LIPHQATADALRRKRIPELAVRLIIDSYDSVTTEIKQGNILVPLPIIRAVKQGDPLSPFVFNALLEPLLLQLESQQGYRINDHCTISTLAFADDVILVASDIPKAKTLLKHTEDYLEGLGMKISAPKCAAFQITTTRDAWFLTDPLLTTKNGDNIPQVTASNTIRYLGRRVSPWKGLTIEGLEEEFRDTFQRVERLALKPHQKELLISRYIIPRFLYSLVLAIPPISTVRMLDRQLRGPIKRIFHLPQCTASGLLY
jgi:hypothetical protein